MNDIPMTEREMLNLVIAQTESDLAGAHEQICKLQSVDPANHRWPEWSPQANSLRWFADIRKRFSLYEHAEESCPGHVASAASAKTCARCGVHIDSLRPDTKER